MSRSSAGRSERATSMFCKAAMNPAEVFIRADCPDYQPENRKWQGIASLERTWGGRLFAISIPVRKRSGTAALPASSSAMTIAERGSPRSSLSGITMWKTCFTGHGVLACWLPDPRSRLKVFVTRVTGAC